MPRQMIIASLAAGAVLVVGCSVGGNAGRDAVSTPAVTADTSATAQATNLLRAGTTFIEETSFRTDVDIAGQVITMSHTDNVARRASATVSFHGQSTEIRMVDDEVYMKTEWNLPGVGDGWMLLDPAKVPPDFTMSFDPGKNDPGGSARLINAIVSAQMSGRQITGTLDSTEVGEGNGITFRPGPDGTFPEGARSQPFQATLDGEGRLVSFVIPSYQGSPNASLRYNDFGAGVDVTRPQGAVPAPDALYPQLGLP